MTHSIMIATTEGRMVTDGRLACVNVEWIMDMDKDAYQRGARDFGGINNMVGC